MPIFSRRRTQQMLDDLIGIAAPTQFIGRLHDKRFGTAFSAEVELGLGLVWAVIRHRRVKTLENISKEPSGIGTQIYGRLPKQIRSKPIYRLFAQWHT